MKAELLTDWLIGLTQESSPFFSVYRFLIQTTIYLTVTALFIILFKQIFKNRIRAKWHFLIWIVLLIRLVVPILPTSPVSIFNAAKIADDTIVQSSYYSYVDNNSSTVEGQDDNYTVAEGLQRMIEADQNKSHFDNSFEDNRTDVGDGSATSSGAFVPISTIVVCIWLDGAVLLLLYFVIVYAVCIHRLKKQRSASGDNINAILDSCKEQLKVKRNVRIYHADTTPTLIGLFRPTIYLPDTYSGAELRNVLLHELCHMKHMDVLWSLLAVLILCMNWFNPILWVCFFLFKRDIEVYCDERTLRYAEDKQSYAMLLLKTATSRKERFVLGTTSLQSGKADVKRRIRFMAKFKKPSVALVLVAVILVGVITTACLTNSVSKNTTNEEMATISNDLSNIEYDGHYYTLCSEDLFFDGRTKPDDAVKIESTIIDYDIMPIIEYNNLYKSEAYPDYLFLDTTLDESYKEFLAAQKGVTVLYKISDLLPISNMDYEGIYSDDSFQMFRSKQSLEELRETVLSQQSAGFLATTISDNEFLASWQGTDTLFSKEIFDSDGKQLDDTYVIATEQRIYNDNGDEFHYPYPYHLTKNHWTLSESESGYSLSYSGDDPFVSNVQLKTGPFAFTNLIKYYQDHNCDIQYEGGNLTGGIIFVTLDPYSGTLFRILVTANDNDTFSMRYWVPGSPDSSYAETVIRRYMSALNEKDKKVFVNCFEDIDESAADNFLDSVKSCSFQNAEIFWIDEEKEKYIFKVSYRLITEDGKTIGSYGTGKMDLIEYFTVSTNNSDHEPLIVNKFGSFADCIHELSNNQ